MASLWLWLPVASRWLLLPVASLSLWLPVASLSLWLPLASLSLLRFSCWAQPELPHADRPLLLPSLQLPAAELPLGPAHTEQNLGTYIP